MSDKDRIAELEAQVAALTIDRATLAGIVDGLREYAEHGLDCPLRPANWVPGDKDCDCGLADLLDAIAALSAPADPAADAELAQDLGAEEGETS